jgi:hypothetical protein
MSSISSYAIGRSKFSADFEKFLSSLHATNFKAVKEKAQSVPERVTQFIPGNWIESLHSVRNDSHFETH